MYVYGPALSAIMYRPSFSSLHPSPLRLSRAPPTTSPLLSLVFSLPPPLLPAPRPAARSGNEMLFSENGAGMRTGLPPGRGAHAVLSFNLVSDTYFCP